MRGPEPVEEGQKSMQTDTDPAARHAGYRQYVRALLLGAVLSLAWGAVSGVLHLDRVFSNQAQERLFSESLPVQIALYGFVSPVLEELLFRGLLYTMLRKLLPDRISAVITAVLFALWHGNMIQILYAFPMGLLFQYLLKKDGTLISPVCCHIGSNLTAVIVQAFLI